MATFTSPYVSLRQYFEMLKDSEIRYEYWDGELRAMAGASRNHNALTLGIGAALWAALRGSKCRADVAEQLVREESSSRLVFPDVVVSCESARIVREGIDVLLDPVVVVEVLSPSTAKLDRTSKFEYYSSFASVKDLLIVSQDEMLVEHHWRGSREEDWKVRHYYRPEEEIDFVSIGVKLSMAAIYERVEIEERPVAQAPLMLLDDGN